jgi:hypothetical protein
VRGVDVAVAHGDGMADCALDLSGSRLPGSWGC